MNTRVSTSQMYKILMLMYNTLLYSHYVEKEKEKRNMQLTYLPI